MRILSIALGLVVLPALADEPPTVPMPRLLPSSCEIELALSAAPEHLREHATVYVLKQKGYERAREGTNGFVCIVNRDHPRVLKPTCFDAEGAATIVPRILHVGKRMMAAVPLPEIQREVEAKFEDGTFISPRRAGVAYMLSHYNRPYLPTGGNLGWFPPHFMFYAPNLTNEQIGYSPLAARDDFQLPFVAYQGPHGYIITLAERTSRPEDHPIPSCPEWVGANPPSRP